MRKKQKQKRLFISLAAALLLLITVPLMAAMASESDDAVSGSDLSAAAVSGSDAVSASDLTGEKDTVKGNLVVSASDSTAKGNVSARYAEPKRANGEQLNMDDDFVFFFEYDLGYGLSHTLNTHTDFNGRDESVSTVVPECSDPNNTFLYWRDTQTGKIYHPGDTLTVKVSDMKFLRYSWYNDETQSVEYNWEPDCWFLKAIWESETMAVDKQIELILLTPETNPNPYRLNYWQDDGINLYNWFSSSFHDVKGTYNLRTDTYTLDPGYDKIKIPNDVPAIDGDTFIGWNTASDGSGKSYQPGDEISVLNQDADGKTYVDFSPTLYAMFRNTTKKNVVKFFFYCYNVSDETTEFALQYDDNGIVPQLTFPAALTNPINTFKCWSCAKNGQTFEAGKTYYNVDIKNLVWDDFQGRSNVLYAYFSGVWNQDEVSFERTGYLGLMFEGGERWLEKTVKGTYRYSDDKWTYTDGSIVIPADSAPDNERGFTFTGWNTSEYGVGKNYMPGETFYFTEYPSEWLFATFKSDQNFTVVETTDEVINTIQSAEPVLGITFVNNADISEIKMVVSNVEDNLADQVLNALKEMTELTEIEAQPNYEMLDIKLVDSKNHGVTIESGKIKIILAYPNIPNAKDYVYTIYHYNNGVLEEIPVEKFDGGLAFYADSFSPFTLVWNEEKEDNDSSGSNENKPPVIPEVPVVGIAKDKDGNLYTKEQIDIEIVKYSAKDAEQYIKLTGEDPENAVAYDIKIKDKASGKELELINGNTLSVELPSPALTGNYSFNLYHIVDNKAIPVKISQSTGNKKVFEANGFSPYVLAWHEIKSGGNDSPATGDSFNPMILIVLLIASFAAAAVTAYCNKEKIMEIVKAR